MTIRVLEVHHADSTVDPTLRAMLTLEIATADFVFQVHDVALHARSDDTWEVRTSDPQRASLVPLFNAAGVLLAKPVTFPTERDAGESQRAAIAATRAYAPDILELEKA